MYKEFVEEFYPKLGCTKRWDGFQCIVSHLAALNRPGSIVETGTIRPDGTWDGDGRSTLIWDWLAQKYQFEVWSVDNNVHALEEAQSLTKSTKYALCDSILFLSSFNGLSRIDLLYLDSYDWGPDATRKTLSELHHVGELASIYERLPSGCLIATDDHVNEDEGKHVLIDAFFKRLQVQPLLKSYQIIWQKP
jgi:hypothetical protein